MFNVTCYVKIIDFKEHFGRCSVTYVTIENDAAFLHHDSPRAAPSRLLKVMENTDQSIRDIRGRLFGPFIQLVTELCPVLDIEIITRFIKEKEW